MDYETLDKIADAYIPSLAVLFCLGLLWQLCKKQSKSQLFKTLLFCLGMLVFSYGLMFLDNALLIWPVLGLDYSTHTSVSFSLAISVGVLMRPLRKLMMGLFASYLALMWYQQYHTVADMVTTLIPVMAFAYFLFRVLLATPQIINGD
ncbi:MAG: hypothetical protein ACRDDD_08170 [Plesiomonas sp.]|uniref:hypothetical protein n=1 Tax=Plesiomonas sp. TaxID=2486279 RepID=UPI003EE7CB6B